MPVPNRFGAIEAGGTKIVCAWSDERGDILKQHRIPTTKPDEVTAEITRFFQSAAEDDQSQSPVAIGVATFGPVCLDEKSPSYGSILKTPKAGWEGTNWIQTVRSIFPKTQVVIETDVNAAALGEIDRGAARALQDVVYFTVGTGIGAGIVCNGSPLHGLAHPEAGHIRIPRTGEEKRTFTGICPFHGDCLEGIASGPAMEKRWGKPAQELPEDHPAWDLEADALAWACINMIATVSPRRIIIGGGVSQGPGLFPKIRRRVAEQLNGYFEAPEITEHIDQFIVPPKLGQQAGLYGAALLALTGILNS